MKLGNIQVNEFTARISAPLVELEKKHNPFYERDGQDLTESNAFSAKTVAEKTDWILKAGLIWSALSVETSVISPYTWAHSLRDDEND